MVAPDRKVFEAAATWYVQFQSQPPTPAEHCAWQQWLNDDPAHLAAWKQMERLQRSLGTLPQDLTRRALSATQQRRQVLKWMLVLGGTGYLGWNIQHAPSLGNVWADYRTRIGERRRIELADGAAEKRYGKLPDKLRHKVLAMCAATDNGLKRKTKPTTMTSTPINGHRFTTVCMTMKS